MSFIFTYVCMYVCISILFCADPFINYTLKYFYMYCYRMTLL